jgi:glycosidase
MKPVIYQVFVRLFGNRNEGVSIYGTIDENGCGKFDDINEAALFSLKNFGITHIWYTGIIEHAVATDYSHLGIPNDFPEIVKGRAGSPYAIKDYFDVNPDLAMDAGRRMREFESLVERTHNAGLKVIIDFVPNHVARVYGTDTGSQTEVGDFGINDDTGKSFSAFNDFYYLPGQELKLPEEIYEKTSVTEYRKKPVNYREFPARVTGNDCFSSTPGYNDWYETVKLNYGVDYMNGKQAHFHPVPPLWNKMKSVILFWAGKNVDGFRADMAEMVPIEFWKWLISSVKKRFPDLLFIAEIYQPDRYRDYIETGGFDYLYDKMDFYDITRQVIEGKADTRSITWCWQRVGDLEKYMLRFLENHDEQRIASRFFAGDPWKAIPGMVLAATMNSGPLLIYSGQEVGEPAEGQSGFSGDDGRTTIFDYWIIPNHQKWMNHGKFDGGGLPDDLAGLRRTYEGITGLCREKLFSEGCFYDLMWVNNHLYGIPGTGIYAYLRYSGGRIAIVMVNFGYNACKGAMLHIPGDAWEAMNAGAGLKVVNKVLFPQGEIKFQETVETNSGVVFDLPGYSGMLIFLKSL